MLLKFAACTLRFSNRPTSEIQLKKKNSLPIGWQQTSNTLEKIHRGVEVTISKWKNNREQDEFPVIFRDFSMDLAFAFCFCSNGISRPGKQLLLKPP